MILANDVVFNTERSEFFAVGDNGFWGRSENCMNWTVTTINNVSTAENQDDNISIADNNDFLGIVTGGDFSAVWTNKKIYFNDVYAERDSLVRSQLDIDNYTVNDIDWYEAEERFIGFIEDHNGVIRIEDSHARWWSSGEAPHDDGDPLEGIKIVGGRENYLLLCQIIILQGFFI